MLVRLDHFFKDHDEDIKNKVKPPPTPLKFNMEAEKKSLEKEIPFGNHHFQVPC